jgi:hypothetical protein
MRAHFCHESCVNQPGLMKFGGSEVVLAQAILGLLDGWAAGLAVGN